MKQIVLPSETTLKTGYTHKVELTYADLTAAAGGSDTTVTIQLYPFSTATASAGTVVRAVGFKLVTAFDASDASVNSLLLELGDGGATARFMAQTQLAVDGTEILYAAGTANATQTLPYAYPTADGIDVKFTVAGGGTPTIDELNAGEVHIFLGVFDMDDVAAVTQP